MFLWEPAPGINSNGDDMVSQSVERKKRDGMTIRTMSNRIVQMTNPLFSVPGDGIAYRWGSPHGHPDCFGAGLFTTAKEKTERARRYHASS